MLKQIPVHIEFAQKSGFIHCKAIYDNRACRAKVEIPNDLLDNEAGIKAIYDLLEGEIIKAILQEK